MQKISIKCPTTLHHIKYENCYTHPNGPCRSINILNNIQKVTPSQVF